MEEKKRSKKGLVIGIIISVLVIIIAVLLILILSGGSGKKSDEKEDDKPVESSYKMKGNGIEKFDLAFLQLENKEENKIYSPLSIKYALAMLNEGTAGSSKKQIESVIGEYKAKKYTNSSNMSLANAIFIKDSLKNDIKEDYVNKLIEKFNAEVIYDSFTTADKLNNWVSSKTLNLIKKLVDDIDSGTEFLLVNALGIDMEWTSNFIANWEKGCTSYVDYSHEKFSWYGGEKIISGKFKNVTDDIATMQIYASFNNYDIIKTLGEDNIRKTVGDEYRKYLNTDYYYKTKSSSEREAEVKRYLDEYIKEIGTNYKREDKTTEFTFYVDDDVKVFAKDLKTYDGTTLQYVAFLPKKEELKSFVENVTSEKINEYISKLIELKKENFKDGYVTKIKGTIPKFKFEYSLDLMEDLKKLGITDVFDKNKVDISGITSSKNVYIGEAVHKANIEFTQEGIKASAATMMGGLGAADSFDYLYDVPTEEIDLTFDNPYMFIIRDKDSGEVWFTGTVYTPSLWKDDPDSSSNLYY